VRGVIIGWKFDVDRKTLKFSAVFLGGLIGPSSRERAKINKELPDSFWRYCKYCLLQTYVGNLRT
jgi:hypothetical protein